MRSVLVWLPSGRRKGLPLAERRRLRARVASAPLAAPGAGTKACGNAPTSPIVELVLGIAAVQAGSGRGQKLSVTEAKAILRRYGDQGSQLAARLGKLSKRRNLDAHPDVTLVCDIKDFLASLD